jgi:hypothetical protein
MCLTKEEMVFEEDINNKFLGKIFLECKTCSLLIYNDVKNYFEKYNQTFAFYYNQIISSKYTEEHFTLDEVDTNNPIYIMLHKIITTSNDFKNLWDTYIELVIEREEIEREEIEREEIERHPQFIEDYDLDFQISQSEPIYNPRMSDWYFENCPNEVHVFNDKKECKHIVNCNSLPIGLIMESMFNTYMFEFLTQPKILPILRKFLDIKNNFLSETLKTKLVSIKNGDPVLCHVWKGANYYYQKLYIKSIYLDHIPISKDELLMKQTYNFHEMIQAHPKASHGWAYESWLEYQELMRDYIK